MPALPEATLGAAAFRAQLVARDYAEAVCFAFLDATTLKQWSSTKAQCRSPIRCRRSSVSCATSLLPGLVSALIANRRRQQERVRLFELGNVFAVGKDAPAETTRFAGVAIGTVFAEQWGEGRSAAW